MSRRVGLSKPLPKNLSVTSRYWLTTSAKISDFCVPQFYVLACTTTTSDPIDRRRPQADSAHQIGLQPTLHAVLIVGGDAVQGGEKTLGGIFGSGVFNLFACNSTTKGVMVKWRQRLDSAGQKGPEIAMEGVLILAEVNFTAERNGSGLTKSQSVAPVFLRISHKLLSVLVAFCSWCLLPQFARFDSTRNPRPQLHTIQLHTLQLHAIQLTLLHPTS
jgi:hypothetical protein